MPPPDTEITPDKPFGESPFKGKKPASMVEQLALKIESLPHDEVTAAFAATEQALKEHREAPGKALKMVGGVVLGILSKSV